MPKIDGYEIKQMLPATGWRAVYGVEPRRSGGEPWFELEYVDVAVWMLVVDPNDEDDHGIVMAYTPSYGLIEDIDDDIESNFLGLCGPTEEFDEELARSTMTDRWKARQQAKPKAG